MDRERRHDTWGGPKAMTNNYRALVFGPRFSSSKFKTSERRTNTRPPTVAVLSRPRFINSLIDALETLRRRAASACEIKSSADCVFFFFSTILSLHRQDIRYNYLNNVKVIKQENG